MKPHIIGADSLLSIFAHTLVTPSGCIEWQGSRSDRDYGLVCVGAKRRRVHRYVWELLNGPIPDGMKVCHRCDNRPCCNPDDLFLGTQVENIRDRHTKGRSVRGERDGRAVLTEDDVRSIRARYASGEQIVRILRDFDVSRGAIDAVVQRRSWRHLHP